MAFDMNALDGLQVRVLTNNNNGALILIELGSLKFDELARYVEDRHNGIVFSRKTPSRYKLLSLNVAGSLSLMLGGQHALLHVRRPSGQSPQPWLPLAAQDPRMQLDALPMRVGRFVTSQTDSKALGFLFGSLTALAVADASLNFGAWQLGVSDSEAPAAQPTASTTQAAAMKAAWEKLARAKDASSPVVILPAAGVVPSSSHNDKPEAPKVVESSQTKGVVPKVNDAGRDPKPGRCKAWHPCPTSHRPRSRRGGA